MNTGPPCENAQLRRAPLLTSGWRHASVRGMECSHRAGAVAPGRWITQLDGLQSKGAASRVLEYCVECGDKPTRRWVEGKWRRDVPETRMEGLQSINGRCGRCAGSLRRAWRHPDPTRGERQGETRRAGECGYTGHYNRDGEAIQQLGASGYNWDRVDGPRLRCISGRERRMAAAWWRERRACSVTVVLPRARVSVNTIGATPLLHTTDKAFHSSDTCIACPLRTD